MKQEERVALVHEMAATWSMKHDDPRLPSLPPTSLPPQANLRAPFLVNINVGSLLFY
jgi:hypothetical protein